MDKNLLLDNILNNIGLSIFWKDSDRRFLGANKSFLDYYNFTIDDILEKNDEDMNWHIDPEPFKKEEERVINEGYHVNNLQGNCIIRGQMRYILPTNFLCTMKITRLLDYGDISEIILMKY